MRRYFEFAAVVILLAILLATLLFALQTAQRQMEEAAMQAEVSAIQAQLLERMARHEAFGGSLPASDNPVDWVTQPPAHYAGAVDALPAGRAGWYYETPNRQLVYQSADGGQIRYRLSRQAGGQRGALGGVTLMRVGQQGA